jgi:hypothetical protein
MFSSLIGIGIILMTPNVVNMLKQMLKAPKTDMSALGQTIGAGAGVLTGSAKTSLSAGSSYLFGDPFTQEKRGAGVMRTLGRKFFG